MIEHVRITFNTVNTVLMCKIHESYENTDMLVEQSALMHLFWKRQGVRLLEHVH